MDPVPDSGTPLNPDPIRIHNPASGSLVSINPEAAEVTKMKLFSLILGLNFSEMLVSFVKRCNKLLEHVKSAKSGESFRIRLN
jgi:hypothetical protein